MSDKTEIYKKLHLKHDFHVRKYLSECAFHGIDYRLDKNPAGFVVSEIIKRPDAHVQAYFKKKKADFANSIHGSHVLAFREVVAADRYRQVKRAQDEKQQEEFKNTDISESEARSLVGTYAAHQYREWSDEHRIMHKIAAPYSLPPLNSGQRKTSFLTPNAARKMAASCEFVSVKRGGYTTFLTLTFDAEARERLQLGGTIQAEVSRFFDGLQKMYRRGWVANTGLQKMPVPAAGDSLDYLWVAENPDSYLDTETGEMVTNPHVHVLMRWAVPYALFEAWAGRIEKLWGQGFAHLEKLRSKKQGSAAAYLMKALQYLAKAAGASDQGTVYGNRYGISKSARAPEWETLYTFAWAALGQMIERARMKQNRTRKPMEQKRDYLKKQLEEASDKKQKNAIFTALQKVREKLESVKGDIFYGRNRVVAKGEEAKNRLFNWFKSQGFEWFDKPLSVYSEALRVKQVKKDSFMIRWHRHTHRLGWENNIPEWWAAVAKHRELANKYAWF